jgi:hypothetical protein
MSRSYGKSTVTWLVWIIPIFLNSRKKNKIIRERNGLKNKISRHGIKESGCTFSFSFDRG